MPPQGVKRATKRNFLSFCSRFSFFEVDNFVTKEEVYVADFDWPEKGNDSDL